MAIDNADLQLFQIIYGANPDKPMEFIQEEVLKAKKALLDNCVKMELEANNIPDDGKKKPVYVELKKSDLVFKTRTEIDDALGEDSITCCICGRKMNSLGAHLRRTHHVNPDDYIRVCGYPEGTSLMGKTLLKNARANMDRVLSIRKAHKAKAEAAE